jgi:cysteine-rich repeat protein
VQTYSTFTGSFPAGSHTIGFTTGSIYESPIEPFPAQTFGGGGGNCADADFDGICNNIDSCPLDAANDGDADGVCGNVDNCPLDYNPTQTDANNNGQGDTCEGNVCGNGIQTGSEQCDDGNIAGGDGCSAICTTEVAATADSPPIANAGPDNTENEGQPVTLVGTLSNDPDGDTLTYAWVQLSGTTVTLDDATSSQPTFTTPFVASGGDTLTFQLIVTDTVNLVSSAPDTVNITVSNVNHTPVADAGDDQSIVEGSPVAMDGSGSFDEDNDSITYSWVQSSGPTVVITNENTATPSFMAPVVSGGNPGDTESLVFMLAVDDGLNPSAPASGYTLADVQDTVTVTITNVNNDPTADAGSDKTINEFSAVQLNGGASNDPVSDMLTYAWVQTGGPVVALTGDTTMMPSLTTPFVSPGGTDLTFEITVDDGYGGTGTDTMVIHVQNSNDAPLVSAAVPSIDCLWPPNHGFVNVGINGVNDPNDNETITIDSITQDEPVGGLGDGDTSPDAIINDDGTVLLRAERSGQGNGRMYHIYFTASDFEGSDSGVVEVCVRNKKNDIAIDDGELYDSTGLDNVDRCPGTTTNEAVSDSGCTARQSKERALAVLGSLSRDKKAKKAKKHIEKSLINFVSDNVLSSKGKKTFKEERRAVKHLAHLHRHGHKHSEHVDNSAATEVITLLVDADRLLAAQAIDDSVCSAKQIEKAEKQMARAESETNAKKAIKHFEHAWHKASHCHKEKADKRGKRGKRPR